MNSWNRPFHTFVWAIIIYCLGTPVHSQPAPDSCAGLGPTQPDQDTFEQPPSGYSSQPFNPAPHYYPAGSSSRPFNPYPHYYPPGNSPQPYNAPAEGFAGYSQNNRWNSGQGSIYPQTNFATIPQGIILPITLDTTISTSTAKPGDYIQAHINQNITLGGAHYLPGGTVVSGEVSEPAGKRTRHANELTIAFSQLRLPTGAIIALAGHLVGRIGDYVNRENPRYNESLGTRLAQAGMHSGVGVGLGGVLGSAEGAVASGGRGFSGSELTGAGIGSTVGALSSLLWRHASPSSAVLLHAGTQMQLQLDEPADIPDPHSTRNYSQQPSGQY